MLRHLVISITVLIVFAQSAYAEDVNVIFEKVNKLIAEKNYPKAMEELAWAKKEIEKMHSARIQEFFPATVIGLQGADVKASGAMGFSNIERTYSGQGKSLNVSLQGSSATGAGGGIAAFGRMAALMGQQDPNSESFRIDGLTASLKKNGSNNELQVFLDSGSILNISSRNGLEADELKKVAEAIDIVKLDDYLRGRS
jgi:hypothetical protein